MKVINFKKCSEQQCKFKPLIKQQILNQKTFEIEQTLGGKDTCHPKLKGIWDSIPLSPQTPRKSNYL